MSTIPKALYSAYQTRELDRLALEQCQLSSATLMARAGDAALDLIQQQWPAASSLLIFCGSGHNGGDGFELARQAAAKGLTAHIVLVGKLASMSDEVDATYQAAIKQGAKTLSINDDLPATDLLVDGLLGTGLNREVSGDFALAIEKINAWADTPVLALDIPSGLNADTGSIMGSAVIADITLNFIGVNIGLRTHDGPDICGELAFADLAIPESVYQQVPPLAEILGINALTALLTPRKRNSHKGHFGHVLVIGGNQGMAGAVHIAAQAAARTGAGLISVATHSDHAAFLNLQRPEIMCHAVAEPAALDQLINKATVICLGPGLGQDDWAQMLFAKAMASDKPIVVDADALNLLSRQPTKRANWILTPHPGEAASLLGISNKAVQNDRPAAAIALQKRYGGVAVLKGCGSLICADDDPLQLSPYGNPGMASGGMGDCLTGIIGGLLAQNFTLADAAQIAVVVHGLAADHAAATHGQRGLLALDLLPFLQRLLNLKDVPECG
ncbi:MAG: NAD(P)H-hydrate dehydratase [Methylophaga sp.]|nr:NAD(P)H-hydrate dehydratase [Methylophaga sp.]